MAILLDKNTRVIVQGITGKAGSFHAGEMRAYGTLVVGGVTPGRGGARWEGLPIFDTVAEAVRQTQATATAIFVPARFGAEAILEAVLGQMSLIVVITEGIPALDMVKVRYYLQRGQTPLPPKGVRPLWGQKGTGPTIIGPNGPGIITPGEAKIGIMPGYIHKPGAIGVVSRSGTLTYEAVWQLTQLGLGQSTCVGIGGDSVPGTGFVEILKAFQEDPQTEGIVLIGEIGGTSEEEAAVFIAEHLTKPVVAFVAGATAPKEKRMGHAGAVIAQGQGTHISKIQALKNAGVTIAENPASIGQAMRKVLSKVLLIFLLASAVPAWADETIEMSTYIPAPGALTSNLDRLHAKRATIGSPYDPSLVADSSVPDGSLFISGKVGIGTSDPRFPLHVVGDADGKGLFLQFAGLGWSFAAGDPRQNAAEYVLYRGGSAAVGNLTLRRYAADHTLFRIWAPPAALGSNEATLSLLRGDNEEEYMDFYTIDYGNPQHGIRIQKRGSGAYRPFYIDFSDGATITPALSIFPSGNVGIGTAAPAAGSRLHVSGGPVYNDGANAGYLFFDRTIPAGYGVLYRTGGVNRLYDNTAGDVLTYTSGGNVGIGTAAPRARLEVNGAILLTPTGAPSSPPQGAIYFDATAKHFYGYDGTAWRQLDN